ncbi:MAG: hypothetical protein K9L28_05825 [Synergistales bacterium]|nr:hypothetical protein [Synergistales bacterium]
MSRLRRETLFSADTLESAGQRMLRITGGRVQTNIFPEPAPAPERYDGSDPEGQSRRRGESVALPRIRSRLESEPRQVYRRYARQAYRQRLAGRNHRVMRPPFTMTA